MDQPGTLLEKKLSQLKKNSHNYKKNLKTIKKSEPQKIFRTKKKKTCNEKKIFFCLDIV